MSKKPNKRSVGIQSSNIFNLNIESGRQLARLQKKAGFRNLLQKSVTIGPQEYDDSIDNFAPMEGQRTRSVQATLENEFVFKRYRSKGESLEFSLSRKHTFGQDNESRTTSEMMRVIEQGTRGSYPGTSRMTSGAFSYMSVSNELNDSNLQDREGSLAVYNYKDKPQEASMSHSFPYFYGSQGSRRFSDESVLLIEDYQSYDQENVAGMQDQDVNRRNIVTCCSRRTLDPATDVLRKPLPLAFEKFDEEEEAVCRICHEGDDVEHLIQPCLCKGSVGCVHASCLKVWLEQSSTNRCELCNYPYAVRQTLKYSKCVSVRVFYKAVIDRRALTYDIISFVVITPLTLVGVAMCIQASVFSTARETSGESSYQMGYITKIGMIMLSGTIIMAYGVWFYTLISFHFKSWKNWYSNCFDVEVIPVRMTSEERIEAARRLNEEMSRRHQSREHGSVLTNVMNSHSFYQRPVSVPPVLQVPYSDREFSQFAPS